MQNDLVPLYPQVYPTAQMQKKENTGCTSAPQEMAAPFVNAKLLLGPENTLIICPFCYASIKTAVKYTTTTRTHIAAALCCIACCMCCIPYGSESAKNSDHYCPNCQKYLGTYEK